MYQTVHFSKVLDLKMKTHSKPSVVPVLHVQIHHAMSLIVGSKLNIQYSTRQQPQKPTATEHKRCLYAVMQIIGRQRFMWYFQFQAGLIMPLKGGK